MRVGAVVAAWLLFACGDDGTPMQPPDAPPAPTCMYRETFDAQNAVQPERTGLTLAPSLTLCGQIDAKAPVGTRGLVDRDRFEITVGNNMHLLTIEASDAAAIDRLVVEFRGNGTFDTAVLEGRRATLVMLAELPPGATAIDVVAYSSAQPASDVPYTISIEPLDITRCPVGESAGYVEANDGSGNIDNDVVTVINNGTYEAAQTTATDAPEVPPLMITAGGSIRVDGTAGVNATHPDMYKDRDVYVIPTDEATRSLDLRLTWDDATGTGDDSDLDIMVLNQPAGAAAPVYRVGGGNGTSPTAPEFAVVAVQPSTTYWFAVANAAGPTVTKAYTLTICGHP